MRTDGKLRRWFNNWIERLLELQGKGATEKAPPYTHTAGYALKSCHRGGLKID
jgi:hypothetical protein